MYLEVGCGVTGAFRFLGFGGSTGGGGAGMGAGIATGTSNAEAVTKAI
jgi:hypothetical protein